MAVGEQVAEGGPDELLSFAPLEDGNGLEIVDHIERRHLSIETSNPVYPQEASTDIFEFPISHAVSIETEVISIPQQLGVIVRNSLGFMVAEITKNEQQLFPKDRYSLDPGAPIKTYIKFDSGFSIGVSAKGVLIKFGSPTKVHFGFRSHHKQPAATITTTENIPNLMKSLSHFSSALKTTTCERSYPTLRGHPPTIELGERLEIPSILTPPDTGISIEVPQDYRSVFTIASLAYYLAADINPGKYPRIVTDTGFEYPLNDRKRGFEGKVGRVLKQVFFLDCITRTEGFFQVNLHERNQIENLVNLDFVNLYDEPLATQVESYLDVPYHLVEPYLPKWKLTAHITPDASYTETIPYLVNDLAIIKSPETEVDKYYTAQTTTIEDFKGSRGDSPTARATIESAPTPTLIRIEEDNSIEQAWIGKGAPLGASKAMIKAFKNRTGRSPADHDIDITVVCNAAEMGQERDLVNEVYGSRKELPFDVSIHKELTAQELGELLEEDIDFLHYIGHIDAGGFECIDGRFDAASLTHTGVDVFFLNACTSYEQGRHLINAGSIAGVVTLQDIINSGAERVGMALARLLNCGFPLRPSLGIAQKESIMGGHYLVIGDGSIEIAQPRVGIQGLCDIIKREEDWSLQFVSFPTHDKGIGSIIAPHIDSCEEIFLISGDIGRFRLDKDDMAEFLQVEEMPIRYNGKLTWSSDFLTEMI